MSLPCSKWQHRRLREGWTQRHSSQNSRADEMILRFFLLLTTTSALPSAEPEPDANAEPQLYGGLAGVPQRFDSGGLQPGEGGQGYFPGGAGGASVVEPGSVWGGGVPQGDQCGMMDQCCGG